MMPYNTKFFMWDCVPFHPHNLDNILSIRTPRKEISSCSELLSQICNIIDPKKILAVGKIAESALNQIKVECDYEYVRHPSFGGAKKFEAGVERFFRLIE